LLETLYIEVVHSFLFRKANRADPAPLYPVGSSDGVMNKQNVIGDHMHGLRSTFLDHRHNFLA